MGIPVKEVVQDAEIEGFGAVGPQKLSRAKLLRSLSRQDRQIMNMISQIAPDLVTREATIDCVDAGNLNGYTLEDGLHYRDFVHVDPDDDEYTPINIVMKKDRDLVTSHPAGFLQTAEAAGMFLPVDPDGDRWQSSGDRSWFEPSENHQFSYSYVPLAGRVTSMSDRLESPELARDVLTITAELAVVNQMPPGRVDPNRLELILQKRQGAMDNLRMQLEKFKHPQGDDLQRGRRPRSDRLWAHEEAAS